MGGCGSGRWAWHTRKTTVEETLILDMNRTAEITGLKKRCYSRGNIQWSRNGEAFSNVSYEANTLELNDAWIKLQYTQIRDKVDVNYRIELTTTEQNFGGRRWWFVCPLVVNNRICNKRVGKLYLPSGGKYFGCRHCYDLTYTSCLESRQFDSLYKHLAKDLPGMTPDTVRRLMKEWK